MQGDAGEVLDERALALDEVAEETHVDVELAVWGLVEDAGVALHRPLVQAEGNLRKGVQVQPRLPQHQRKHLANP